jgi:hypothetical protein
MSGVAATAARLAGAGLACAGIVGLLIYNHTRKACSSIPVPHPSLLSASALAHGDVYADAFQVAVHVPLAVRLSDEQVTQLFARALFGSALFATERAVLRLVPAPGGGKSSGDPDPDALDFSPGARLAHGHFVVAASAPRELLLRWGDEARWGVCGVTYLGVHRGPGGGDFSLRFGSALWGERHPWATAWLALRLHRAYSELLLHAGARRFELLAAREGS